MILLKVKVFSQCTISTFAESNAVERRHFWSTRRNREHTVWGHPTKNVSLNTKGIKGRFLRLVAANDPRATVFLVLHCSSSCSMPFGQVRHFFSRFKTQKLALHPQEKLEFLASNALVYAHGPKPGIRSPKEVGQKSRTLRPSG